MFFILMSFKMYLDAELLKFAREVVTLMKGKAKYTDEQAQVTAVEAQIEVFQVASDKAAEGTTTFINDSVKQREDLLAKLVVLTKLLEVHTTEEEAFFTEAGFKVRQKPVRSNAPLPSPVIDDVQRDVLSGSIRGEVKDFPKGVSQIAVEHSNDNGSTWYNGTYSTGKRFKLEGLTPRKEYLIRTCYVGTFQRRSDWSETKSIFVL